MTAHVWLFAEPIERTDSRWLVESYAVGERTARAQLTAAGYEIGEAEWTVQSGVLADDEPTYRDHEIRCAGALHGWLRVYEEAPPDVVAEVGQQLRNWASDFLRGGP